MLMVRTSKGRTVWPTDIGHRGIVPLLGFESAPFFEPDFSAFPQRGPGALLHNGSGFCIGDGSYPHSQRAREIGTTTPSRRFTLWNLLFWTTPAMMPAARPLHGAGPKPAN